MTRQSVPLLILVSFFSYVGATSTKSQKSHTLRHVEQSVVVLSQTAARADISIEAETHAEVTSPHSSLRSPMFTNPIASVGSFLATEAQVMESTSPKAKLQQQLVSLIWLERVLVHNLNTLKEDNFHAKIAQSKAALEKDNTPATAEVLAKMRTEVNEYSVPFFRTAVTDELKAIRERQKVVLDKIDAINRGKVENKPAVPISPKEDAGKTTEAPTNESDNDREQRELHERIRYWTQNFFISVMSIVALSLAAILVAVAVKVRSHLEMRNIRGDA